jgi:hypothetical protein
MHGFSPDKGLLVDCTGLQLADLEQIRLLQSSVGFKEQIG